MLALTKEYGWYETDKNEIEVIDYEAWSKRSKISIHKGLSFTDWSCMTYIYFSSLNLSSWKDVYDGCVFLTGLRYIHFFHIDCPEIFSFPKSLSHVKYKVGIQKVLWDWSFENFSKDLYGIILGNIEEQKQLDDMIMSLWNLQSVVLNFEKKVTFSNLEFALRLKKLDVIGQVKFPEGFLNNLLTQTRELRFLFASNEEPDHRLIRNCLPLVQCYIRSYDLYRGERAAMHRELGTKASFLMALAKKYPFLRALLFLTAKKIIYQYESALRESNLDFCN